MPQAYGSGDHRLASRSSGKPAGGKIAVGRFILTLLVVVGVAGMQPLPRSMASAQQLEAVASSTPQAVPQPAGASEADIPFAGYDSRAEQVLLDLANQARSKVGVPALRMDAGLSRAAHAHAEAMVSAHQLSHQFEGEASLAQRLADATRLQLDQEGENVALDFSAEDGHKHLMLSAAHRANLLDAAYNVVGIGVMQSDDQLYIVQDFGHALPPYSVSQVKDQVVAAIGQARHQAKLPDLARQDLATVDEAACSMAKADKLGTSSTQQLARRYTVLNYTTLSPEALPSNTGRVLGKHTLRNFAVGVCYARSERHPTGVYWVIVAMQ
jgi:uncharacterized protein YkwD